MSAPPLEGGTARVYRATDLERDHVPVAVKIFHEGRHDSRLLAEFFNRECQSLQELRHPNIVQLLDWGRHESGDRYIVLEWVERTLADRRDESAFEGWDTFADDIGIPMLEALAFAHGRGIWHRDIKPQNILVGVEGTPKVADFSIAKLENQIYLGRTVGDFRSPPFTPPENDDGRHTPARDVYSFAAVTLYCMTEHAFEDYGDVDRALREADLPEDIERVLARCLSRTPVERPVHAGVLLGEIQKVQAVRARGHSPAAVPPLSDQQGVREVKAEPRARVAGPGRARLGRGPQCCGGFRAVPRPSRLEAMTKKTPHSILISESTRRLLRQPPDDLVFVDEVEVPGKRSKIRLWTLHEAP
jgi:serine/threonine protein kinase